MILPPFKKQSGVVLLAAMIMIITVTGIAVALMSSSTIDIKMSNAAQQVAVANLQVKGDATLAIQTEMMKTSQSEFLKLAGHFKNLNAQNEAAINITPLNAQSEVKLFNTNLGETTLNCPQKYAATLGIKCNYLRIQAELDYGKSDKHQITIHNGITQELGISGQSL